MTRNETRIGRETEERRLFSARLLSDGDGMRHRGASEMLGILEPTAAEPLAIVTMGYWRSGGLRAPQLQGAVQ